MSNYRIARIVNTYGIRGELKLLSDTDFPEKRFAKGETAFIEAHAEMIPVTIEHARQHKGAYIVKFAEFDNINDVERFKEGHLSISADQQEELAEDSFYYHEIIGLDVITETGRDLGTIKDILALGSNDVWVVKRREPGKRDALIPYIDDVVKKVDLEQNVVEIELMEGLIDDED
ncbi:ribosome maturation factor RimM [Suicoccus acidiformans]|uniref:Ribosome maturation factor RimM n=1 Tax=Suicoccus acidiformans TaxID=2036206 RepID=A0A347WKU1_9LACT|nr:ribosome maturation factor RimM [Suicoccus acidiformans]AXY25698.1 ribosome maturation factor RimM [Suicoccus acidiformans]